jgi:hypothetical protein
MIKKNIELTPKKLSGLTAGVIVVMTIIVSALISSFLYKNFYQTITGSREIIILREKVAIDTVNLEKFNLVIDKLIKKTKAKELNNIISPFR